MDEAGDRLLKLSVIPLITSSSLYCNKFEMYKNIDREKFSLGSNQLKKMHLILFFIFLLPPAFADSSALEELDFFLFQPNSSDTFANEEQAMIQLDNLAAKLRQINPAPRQVHVWGYCAAAANYIKPENLALERAYFVIKELKRRGALEDIFSAPVGYGEVDFWGDNTTEEGKRLNRRVKVLVDSIWLANYGTVITEARGESQNEEARSRLPMIFFLLLLILLLLLFFIAIVIIIFKRRKKSENKREEIAEVIDCSQEAPPFYEYADPVTEEVPLITEKYAELRNTILEIIFCIPAGAYFDVHTVVKMLLQQYDNVYLKNIGNYTSAEDYHARISDIVGHYTNMTERVGKAYSKDIHKKFGECYLFRRLE